MKSAAIVSVAFVLLVARPPMDRAQDQTKSLNDVYADESHCLTNGRCEGQGLQNQRDLGLTSWAHNPEVVGSNPTPATSYLTKV